MDSRHRGRTSTRQGEPARTAALRVAKAAFEGLAPLLIQVGITSREAEMLLRAACAHESARTQPSRAGKTNVSRVSVEIGVDRHLVTSLLKTPTEALGGLSARRDSMRRVIDGWSSDPQFSRHGRPSDLEIGDPSTRGPSLWTLIQRYAPGVWPRLIVDELIRVDYVETQANGRLRWKGGTKQTQVSRMGPPEAIGQQMRDGMRAAFRDSSQPGAKRNWRTAQGVNIARSDLPLVRKMLRNRFEAMIAWLTEELNSARWQRGPSKGGRMRVGFSGFMFEEPFSGVDSRRDRKPASMGNTPATRTRSNVEPRQLRSKRK
jgi:uncharacterized protein DUF6502